ncbi:4-hydroxyphenylacetate 3-hydroxylase family protein [Chloroflexota bacterium]
MATFEEYQQRILDLKKNVYIDGKIVPRYDPRLQPGMNCVAPTFDAVNDAELADLMIATSHLTGKPVNRFCHVSQTAEDLIAKQTLIRRLCHRSAGCIGRCMGTDAIHALSVATFEIDHELGTPYNKRFQDYLRNFQERDLVGCCAQTDVKGDRRKRPKEQADPDLYLRIIEKNNDGIVVRGAKAHNTVAPYADEIIVVPTRVLKPDEQDWAIAFAIPADWKGVYLPTSAHTYRPRKKIDAPIVRMGSGHSLTIFDDVFVPWERVFMCGEAKYAGRLALLFALFHRHSYTGCKPATTDVLCGSAALAAEYSGIEGAYQVRHALVEYASVAELVFASGIAAAYTGQKSPSGTFIPNSVYCNVGRRHAGLNIYHEFEMAVEIAGGIPSTLPSEGDFYEAQIGPLLEKYMMRNPKISAENQHRCFRFISDYLASAQSSTKLIAGVHGGGSPIMEEIAIYGTYNWEEKKNIVKRLAGIEDSK